MNKHTIYIYKVLRKLYTKILGSNQKIPDCEQDTDKSSQLIYDSLMDDKPCMIARFGSTEMACLMNYIGVNIEKKQILNFIRGYTNPWWWDSNIMNQMQQWSGFFPPSVDKLERFSELLLEDMKQVDVLGSWLNYEKYFDDIMYKCQKINFELLNPFFSTIPWTKALEGKKILVIHPFAKTIENQYAKRKLLFKKEVLPDFELKTIKAVQSIAGEKTDYNDWFDALEYMKSEIDKIDYDICLIGAGAYGFHLAAYVKRSGKKVVHLGGSLQLLFGIRGKRWEDPNYNPIYNYSRLMNEHWVYPGDENKPKNAKLVEGACYW
jgi:hypothetical protein